MKLPKVYEPGEYENDIYALWDKTRVFVADPKSDKERFSIAMPPPNETGTLHIGHALFITLQDIMARYNRLQGKDVLWLPGTDHAALPVNALIEKQLAEEGTNKHQVGRDEFLRRTREFVGNSRDTITTQLRAMGASCDWTRQRYTLDEALNRCVNETFIKMYNNGLIYRGHRIVNWDPKLETNVSDDEVTYIEQKAKFYTLKYGPFEIGTARPETKFGDKYVVMHPDDERYQQYKHGDTFEAEWINGPVTATIIKDRSVDPNFGTGVMTITPWHSVVDFEIAERHGLDRQQIIDFHGKLLPIAGEFAGLSIDEARDKIVDKLAGKGLLIKVDDNYVHNIAVNERGKGVIEPQIRLQWFVDVNKPAVEWKGKQCSLKQVMQAVVNDGDIQIMPERFAKIYFHWIDNLRDWCISRQIWWGHRIPVWYRQDTDGNQETYVGLLPPSDESQGWNDWEQDPDTLDTWFSSALWTWSTLIDPKLAADVNLRFDDLLRRSPDFLAYHPTSVLETAYDILFFWVARMILATTYMTGQVPFRTVYLHGLVRTEQGKKMSKSDPESIIDPLEVIPEYGTDALRLALIQGTAAGNDQRLGRSKIVANRNFCNKLWNIARYIEGIVGDNYRPHELELKTAADHWILYKLRQSTDEIAGHLDNLRFSEAYDMLYHFVWDDFADWYVEASKSEQNAPLLAHCLESILIIAHPFAPFLTETIWQTLAWEGDSVLAARVWPQPEHTTYDKQAEKDFELIKTVVTETRFILHALKATDVTLYYRDSNVIATNGELIKRLAHLKAVEQASEEEGIALTGVQEACWLDIDRSKAKHYTEELQGRLAAQEQVIKQLEGRLSNTSYIERAPTEIVEATRRQLAEARALLDNLQSEKIRFS